MSYFIFGTEIFSCFFTHDTQDIYTKSVSDLFFSSVYNIDLENGKRNGPGTKNERTTVYSSPHP